MRTMLLNWTKPGALAALVVGMGLVLALPASAKTIYSWVTEDGVHSFTDTPKRIPQKYAGEAERKRLRSLRSYDRYTPTPLRDRRAYLERMPGHLETLREKNRPARAPHIVRSHRRADGRTALVLRTGPRDQGGVDIEVAMEPGAEPITIDEVRAKSGFPHTTTRQVTVVRQGEKVLAVIKPHRNDRRAIEIRESELLD